MDTNACIINLNQTSSVTKQRDKNDSNKIYSFYRNTYFIVREKQEDVANALEREQLVTFTRLRLNDSEYNKNNKNNQDSILEYVPSGHITINAKDVIYLEDKKIILVD